MALAEAALFRLDLLAMNPVAQRRELAQRGEELLARRLEARFGGRRDRFDLAQTGAVRLDERRRLIVLDDQPGAAGSELADRAAVGFEILPPLAGNRLSGGDPGVDLGDRAPGAGEELLAPGDGGAELGLAARLLGELRGEPVDLLAQLGELGLLAVDVGGEVGLPRLRLAEGDAALRELAREARPAPAEDRTVERLPLRLALLEAARGPRLALERAQVALDLAHDVVEAQEVRRRLFELQLGDLLARLVAGDPGRLFDQLAALLGLPREDEADLPLLDHRVGADAQSGVHQQVLDLLEADRLAVQAILRLTRCGRRGGRSSPSRLPPGRRRRSSRRPGRRA